MLSDRVMTVTAAPLIGRRIQKNPALPPPFEAAAEVGLEQQHRRAEETGF